MEEFVFKLCKMIFNVSSAAVLLTILLDALTFEATSCKSNYKSRTTFALCILLFSLVAAISFAVQKLISL